MTIPQFDLTKISKDITLEQFIKLLKDNGFTFYSYRSDWNGEVRVKVEIDKIDGDNVRSVYFIFQNRKNPRLQDLEVEVQDELGTWTHVNYKKFSRPWYKGGSIL